METNTNTAANFPSCFRCNGRANQWFDGLGAQEKGIARAICAKCEYQDWRTTVRSLNAPQG